MKILLLPGNSGRNKEWIDGLAKDFEGEFDEVETLHWGHWESGEDVGDWERETEKALEIVKDWKDYFVLGKSFGDLVALNLAKRAENKPTSMYLLGFPVGFAQNIGFPMKPMLDGSPSELVFIQKPKDPASHYEDLVNYLKQFDIPNYKTHRYHVEGESDDEHHYGSSEYLLNLINDKA